MPHVAVLGATGKLGEIIVNRALASGFKVHAFTRDPTRLAQRWNDDLTVYRGDAETGEGLEAALAGCRYVISAFDPGKPVMATCIANVVKLLQSPPVARFVFMSRLGVGDSAPQVKQISGFIPPLVPRLRKGLYEDIGHAEGLVRTSGLPYVILRAAALSDDAHGEVVAAEATDVPPSRVARADLAKFIMRVLEEPGWERREATVGTRRSP